MSSQELATNNNQLPEGYKKTEVGVIPEDWECEHLRDKIVITHGFGFKSQYFCSQGLYWLTTPGNFYEDGGFREIGEKQKYYNGPLPDLYLLQHGDLIVAMTEQAEGLLGSAAIIPKSGTYLHNQRLGKIKPISLDIELVFLYYIFNSKKFRLKVRETAAGTKVKHTSPTKLLEIAIPLPPLPEQKAIAQTLSDVDALIAALDKLIAKKRNIKTATMQQLLTGKTRLPGFGEGKGYKKTEVGVIPEDWKICILSELSQIVTGQTPPTHNRSYYGDEYLFVSPADIGSQKYITNTFAKLSKLGFSISRKYPSKTILFTCIGSTIGKCAIVVTESTSNQQINAILPSNLVNHQYLYYQLINNAKKIKNRAATQAVPIINKTEFGSTFIVVCSDEEQKAIAQVLCDIDTEITALEKRRAKTQAIKQGMMQELLTGKTRLINN